MAYSYRFYMFSKICSVQKIIKNFCWHYVELNYYTNFSEDGNYGRNQSSGGGPMRGTRNPIAPYQKRFPGETWWDKEENDSHLKCTSH